MGFLSCEVNKIGIQIEVEYEALFTKDGCFAKTAPNCGWASRLTFRNYKENKLETMIF